MMATTSASQIIALAIFASYFVLIAVLLFNILAYSIPRHKMLDNRCFIFILLTGLSFFHTWYFMFRFMAWSFSEHKKTYLLSTEKWTLHKIADWLVDTALFEQAWSAVCFGPINWWWSEQLCLFTAGAWTTFLAIEGRRHSIKHVWAYMLLGQVVAISVASNLFYLALSRSSSKQARYKHASTVLWVSVLASLGTVALSPFTSATTFLPNLLTMHALLILPLLQPIDSMTRNWKSKMPLTTLYTLIASIALVLHARTIIVAFCSLPEGHRSSWQFILAAWNLLYSHPAQSSIGWDVVWTTISFLVWSYTSTPALPRSKPIRGLITGIIATAFGSIGFSAPLTLRASVSDDEVHAKKT